MTDPPTTRRPPVSSVVVSTLVSLDGYVAGPGGDISRLPMDGSFDALNLERLRAAGTLLTGATTYRGMVAFWPAVAEDPTVSPAVQLDPSVAELHRETARRNAELPKVVVSDSLTLADAGPWRTPRPSSGGPTPTRPWPRCGRGPAGTSSSSAAGRCGATCSPPDWSTSCSSWWVPRRWRSEEHTSELQSRQYLVCRPLLEKKQSSHSS